jgi:hypothetical protein
VTSATNGSKKESTLESTLSPIDFNDFRDAVLKGLKQKEVEKLPKPSAIGTAYRSLDEVTPAADHNPKAVGWNFLINRNDPYRDEIINAVRPLAEHRGLKAEHKPFYFDDEPQEEWERLLNDYMEVAKYILIIGSPSQVPLKFQSYLSTLLFVGRIDFDYNIENLKEYVQKVIRIEKSDETFVNKEVMFFATNHVTPRGGCPDPTFYKYFHMEQPLAIKVRETESKGEYFKAIEDLVEEKATKEKLLAAVKTSKPCILNVTSQGLSLPNESEQLQKQLTGAIRCHGDLADDFEKWLFTADDINYDQPFLEGGIFIEHADCGYGALAQSSYAWLEDLGKLGFPSKFAEEDFISAIPKKLIFHPKGPLAFIGHVDIALFLSTQDGEAFVEEHWKKRVAPISDALVEMMHAMPVGYALKPLNALRSILNSEIIRMQNTQPEDPTEDEFSKDIIDRRLRNTEAENYMIFGDPATHV